MIPTNSFARAGARGPLRAGGGAGLATAMLLAGCAETAQRPSQSPVAQDVMCDYVGLEAVENESQEKDERDDLSLLATYRFSEANVPPPKDPLTVKFQVERARVNELRGHLEAQPQVICNPDNNAHYQVRVKPFAGKPQVQNSAPPSAAAPASDPAVEVGPG